jgi:hypothetical protein
MDTDSEKYKQLIAREYIPEMQAEGHYPGLGVPNTNLGTEIAEASSTSEKNEPSSPCLVPQTAPVPLSFCKKSETLPAYHRALAPDEIRLLKISSGTDEAALECTTLYEKLNSPPTYVALSYAWGYVDVSYRIKVDGQDFLVSKAVYTALHSLRRQAIFDACDRIVWIDAVCINQMDLDEKTKQVRMMARIYKHATMVVAWLGEISHGDRNGFNLIAQTSKKMRLQNIYNHPSALIKLEKLTDTAVLAEQIGVPYVGHRAWEDVQAIFEKPWWSRVCEFDSLQRTAPLSRESVYRLCFRPVNKEAS